MESIASLLEGRKKIILVHGNADMDAVGSAYALAELFPPADIYAPNGMDRIAKMASEKIGARILEECDISSYELAAVVDTSSPEQLETDQNIPGDAVVIDHHQDTGGWAGHPVLRDGTRTSCCEIILDMYREAGKKPSREAGMMLLGGMITDGGTFQFSDSRLLRAFADVMDMCGIEMDEALEFTRAPVSMSEKTAVLKAMGHVKFDRVGTLTVATATAGSFESSVCRALLNAGADIAFAGSQRENEFRLSGRATQDAVRRGVNLGAVLNGIGEETESSGGGHSGAAGISGTGDAEAMLHICMCRTMEIMREIRARETAEEKRMDYPLLRECYLSSTVSDRNGYSYFQNPISDGVPQVDPAVLNEAADGIIAVSEVGCDLILAPEAMGIPLAAAVSLKTGIPFSVVRKKSYGLPGELEISQQTGYSRSKMFLNGVRPGMKTMIIDDVVDTGGTLCAIAAAVRKAGGTVTEIAAAYSMPEDLSEVSARAGAPIRSLLSIGLRGTVPFIR